MQRSWVNSKEGKRKGTFYRLDIQNISDLKLHKKKSTKTNSTLWMTS